MPGYSERHHLRYTPQQLFDLVADLERYPDFLPWLIAAHIRRREGDVVWVDMVVGTGPLRQAFSSKAELRRPDRIAISSHDPLFDRYEQVWTFQPTGNSGTLVEFSVDFEFRSPLLAAIMGAFLDRAARTMVSAFNQRARQIYGADERPSVIP
jgi:coenzyme Q-binding protein COQ10